jgi:glycosyltransferase involved in cell wall biosynthesis
VLGDIPSLREVWGDAAIYVPPDAPEALAEAINRLSRDPQVRKGMAQAARQRARRYTQEAMGRSYWQALQLLLAGATAPAPAPVAAGPARVIWQQAAVYQSSTHLGR